MSPSEAGIDEARGVPGARATAGDAALPVALPPFGVARLPRIVFGASRRAEIPALVATFGRRALLVTGARSLRASPAWAEITAGLGGRKPHPAPVGPAAPPGRLPWRGARIPVGRHPWPAPRAMGNTAGIVGAARVGANAARAP